MAWRPEQVLALAPDSTSASAGRALGTANKWKTLGADARSVWGTIQGSGSKPYQTCVDLNGPAFKCSCPSRKFPCKHGVGLFLVYAQQPLSLKEKEAPGWVVEWLAKRGEAEEKKQENPAVQRTPEELAKAAALSEKRLASREANVTAGLEELRVFLADVVRGGFASLPGKSARFWERPAARLVDNQAPGLARRLSSLYGITTRGAGWPGDLLWELALLHLAREGWGRLSELSESTQCDLRNAIGFTTNQEALLSGEGVRDRWTVVGQRVLGDEERLRTQRTWLFGERTRQAALCLSFSAGPAQPLDISLIAGTSVAAELVFFPSAFPLRAVLKTRAASLTDGPPVLPHASVSAALSFASAAFAANPWIERVPFGLSNVVPQRDGGWLVRDAQGAFLKLDIADADGWTLLALSGGYPVGLAGEWDGACLRPLSVWAEGRFLRL